MVRTRLCKSEVRYDEDIDITLSISYHCVGRRRRHHSQKSKNHVARVFIIVSLFREQPQFAPPAKPKADVYFFETFNSEEDYEKQYVGVLPCKRLIVN